jgi:purine-nucleoside phosphorylase
MKVFAFSLITNKCETDYDSHEDVLHDDVMLIGKSRQAKITQFVTRMVEEIDGLIARN